MILIDGNGMALYYLTSDTPTSSSCTGVCVSVWPPLSSPAAPTAPPTVPGKLALVGTAGGPQVSYNGHLLYRYRADIEPGRVGGNDRDGPGGGKWFVATPGL
jgi:predicted lipoprotein with Yx(FWY)xxD motif